MEDGTYFVDTCFTSIAYYNSVMNRESKDITQYGGNMRCMLWWDEYSSCTVSELHVGTLKVAGFILAERTDDIIIFKQAHQYNCPIVTRDGYNTSR